MYFHHRFLFCCTLLYTLQVFAGTFYLPVFDATEHEHSPETVLEVRAGQSQQKLIEGEHFVIGVSEQGELYRQQVDFWNSGVDIDEFQKMNEQQKLTIDRYDTWRVRLTFPTDAQKKIIHIEGLYPSITRHERRPQVVVYADGNFIMSLDLATGEVTSDQYVKNFQHRVALDRAFMQDLASTSPDFERILGRITSGPSRCSLPFKRAENKRRH